MPTGMIYIVGVKKGRGEYKLLKVINLDSIYDLWSEFQEIRKWFINM